MMEKEARSRKSPRACDAGCHPKDWILVLVKSSSRALDSRMHLQGMHLHCCVLKGRIIAAYIIGRAVNKCKACECYYPAWAPTDVSMYLC